MEESRHLIQSVVFLNGEPGIQLLSYLVLTASNLTELIQGGRAKWSQGSREASIPPIARRGLGGLGLRDSFKWAAQLVLLSVFRVQRVSLNA